MNNAELELRRTIFESFVDAGAPPSVADDDTLESLAEQHVVVLEPGTRRIVMAHPFAAAPAGDALVDAGDRSWFGNCAWDGLGIVAALGRREATVTSNGVSVRVVHGKVADEALFHVAVPARSWWDDIAYT